jgi:hypothetical protein
MIDYGLLNGSIEFYENKEYQRIESPWTVSEYIKKLTAPQDSSDVNFKLEHNDKCLVASGEQSFLYLYLKDFLPKGRFQTITPCFRYENFDHLHTKYFMKNELIITDEVSKKALDEMIFDCLLFFRQFFDKKRLEKIKTEEGYDIVVYSKDQMDSYELGSYGIRKCDFLTWIYGTGCAEPRTSTLMKKFKKWDTTKTK